MMARQALVVGAGVGAVVVVMTGGGVLARGLVGSREHVQYWDGQPGPGHTDRQ